MNDAKDLLEALTKLYPPGDGQRHNITLGENGEVEFCLMFGGRYLPLRLEPEDYEKPAGILLVDLVKAIEMCWREFIVTELVTKGDCNR